MRLVEQKKENIKVLVESDKPGRLTKYFQRDAASDFSDDGARFTCYTYGPLQITRHYSKDYGYFISARPKDGALNYDEYSKLKHFRDLDKYNGDTMTFTESDLEDFKNICDAFIAEYNEAAGNVEEVNDDEYLEYHRGIKNAAKEYYQKALAEIKNIDIAKMSPWDLKEVQNCLKYLKMEAKDIDEDEYRGHNASFKRETLKNKKEYNPYWYNSLLNRIKEICDKTEDNDPNKYKIDFRH